MKQKISERKSSKKVTYRRAIRKQIIDPKWLGMGSGIQVTCLLQNIRPLLNYGTCARMRTTKIASIIIHFRQLIWNKKDSQAKGVYKQATK